MREGPRPPPRHDLSVTPLVFDLPAALGDGSRYGEGLDSGDVTDLEIGHVITRLQDGGALTSKMESAPD
ncbi:MAG: hypothetical protein Q9Q40_13215 [Acidobacteriota bacterium]|nr:hypothetical protein [Acidobacteriota bacterium]